jgi:hypothetical protein
VRKIVHAAKLGAPTRVSQPLDLAAAAEAGLAEFPTTSDRSALHFYANEVEDDEEREDK